MPLLPEMTRRRGAEDVMVFEEGGENKGGVGDEWLVVCVTVL